ncbi:hypothetical protein PENTCL1PPCAC_13057, partial [Pristionchus entomophagus]
IDRRRDELRPCSPPKYGTCLLLRVFCLPSSPPISHSPFRMLHLLHTPSLSFFPVNREWKKEREKK